MLLSTENIIQEPTNKHNSQGDEQGIRRRSIVTLKEFRKKTKKGACLRILGGLPWWHSG